MALLILLGIAAIVGVATGLAKRKSDQITADVLSRSVPMMRAMGVVWTNRAAQIRAENADRAVTRRGRSFIEFDLGNGRTRHVATIEPLHTRTGTEIDTAWGAAVSPWQYQAADCDYTARIKAAFNGAPLLQFTDKTSGAWVTLQPQQLNWSNNLNSVQMISAVQGVFASLTGDMARWTGAYGAGRHFEYQNHPKRLIKRLILDTAPPAPSSSIISGGNPVLQLQFLFAWSANATVWLDGAEWDKSTTKTTAGSIEFRVGGEVVYRFDAPWASDASGMNTTAGLLRVRKAGNNLYAEVRIPYAWLQAAVYPVVVDPTLTLQPDAAAGKDELITSFQPTFNDGVNPLLAIGRVGGINNDRTLIQFDLSTIPVGATVTSAVLSLYCTNDNASTGSNFTVHRMVRAWLEGTGNYAATGDGATWNTYDGVNNWQTAGAGGALDSEAASIGSRAFTAAETLNEFKNWSLAPAKVQEWISGALANNGMLLKSDNEVNDTSYYFAASDHGTAGIRPKLVIEYTEPVGGGSSRRWLPLMVARRCRG